MISQPNHYSDYLPVIERVFSSGVAPYIHPTGFDATRIITGVDIPEIDPFYTPASPQRGNASGNNRLFTVDRRPIAFQETLGHTGDGPLPDNTFELIFRFEGKTLNFNRVADEEFRTLYFKNEGIKVEDHLFSQCVDYYLEEHGFTTGYDTYGWLSVAAEGLPLSGYVHAWKLRESGTLRHIDTVRLE
jgi:hypothetical protein